MDLRQEISNFWHFVSDEDRHLMPQFLVEEEQRARQIVEFVGIGGVLIITLTMIGDFIFRDEYLLELTLGSIFYIMVNGILALNRRVFDNIPVYPLFYVGLFLQMVSIFLAATLLPDEVLSHILSLTVLNVLALLVAGLTPWLFLPLVFSPLGYFLIWWVVPLNFRVQVLTPYIVMVVTVSPLLIVCLTRLVDRRRWVSFLDRTKIEQINERLQKQTAVLESTNNALQTRNEELDAFAHTVAHDLKNPISMVLGYAGILHDEISANGPEEWHDFIDPIMVAGRKGDTIIEELLLLATVRKEEVTFERLEMGKIVEAAIERLSHHIAGNEVELIGIDEWPSSIGYRFWVEEVWVNYLSNAIKYGGRPCRIELGAELLSEDWVRFWVKDNGKGLTMKEQNSLFSEFTRLDRVRAKGHGLGLSVVRRIMDKLNGQVGVESVVGRGSMFYFELPY